MSKPQQVLTYLMTLEHPAIERGKIHLGDCSCQGFFNRQILDHLLTASHRQKEAVRQNAKTERIKWPTAKYIISRSSSFVTDSFIKHNQVVWLKQLARSTLTLLDMWLKLLAKSSLMLLDIWLKQLAKSSLMLLDIRLKQLAKSCLMLLDIWLKRLAENIGYDCWNRIVG